MAKRQSRRSVSLKGSTYVRVRRYCRAQGRSVSGLLEALIANSLDALGEPDVSDAEARRELAEDAAERERKLHERITNARDAFTF